MRKRKCHFCGNEWKTGEPIPCRCYKQIPVGTIVVPDCPANKRPMNKDLQVCYTCPDYDYCGPREKAQVDKLLAEEKPKKKNRRKVKRGWRGV